MNDEHLLTVHRSSFSCEYSDQNHKTVHPCEPVTQSYIQGGGVSRLEARVDNALTVHRNFLDDPPGRIDERRNPGCARAQKVAIGLDRPQSRLIQMLPRRRGAVVPG